MHNMVNEKHEVDAGTKHYHAVVWLVHHEAKVVLLNTSSNEEITPADLPPHLHIKASSASGTHSTA